MSIEIREAQRVDLPAILELIERLEERQEPWRVFPSRPGLLAEIAQGHAAAIGDSKKLLLVALDDGVVVGTSYAHVEVPSSVSDEPAIELSGVIVRPDHRGRGIAPALVARAARFATEQGVDRITIKVFAQNEDGLKLWERLGFEPRMLQMTAAAEELLGRTHHGDV